MALTTTEVAEFARRTHELLNDEGSHWTKGHYVQEGVGGVQRFCLIGAVRKSIFGEAQGYTVNESDPRFMRIVDALAEAIDALFPTREYGERPWNQTDRVINFNDHDETTWADVEAVLNRAEEILGRA